MKHPLNHRKRRMTLQVTFAVLAFLCCRVLHAQGDYQLDADYENQIQPGIASGVTFFSGSVGAAGAAGTPNAGGAIFLTRSVIGQPVAGNPARIQGEKVYKFGEPIVPAPSLNVDSTVPPALISPAIGAVWISGPNQLYAANPPFVEISWLRPDKTTNSPVRYRVSNEPFKDPVQLYFTHAKASSIGTNLPADFAVPMVSIPASLDPVFFWNDKIGDQIVTNGLLNIFVRRNPVTRTLEAAERPGFILMEYVDSGSRSYRGHEIVQVLPSDNPTASQGQFSIGDKLLPERVFSTAVGVPPVVSHGTNTVNREQAFVYQHPDSNSPQFGEVYAVRATRLATNSIPVEIFWLRRGSNDVIWPYELRRYAADWPFADRTKFQRYVRDPVAAQPGPDVPLDSALSGELWPFQEPSDHAKAISNSRFLTVADGWSLIKYAPSSRVAFQVVHSVKHDDATEPGFVLSPPLAATIGQEILDSGHQGPRPGYIHVPGGDKYDWEIYDGDTNAPPGFKTSQIFAVNVGVLEVWWSTLDSYGNQWPSYVKRYTNSWPANPSKIIVASEQGTRSELSRDLHFDLSIYFQNNPTNVGFNPNDEHAVKIDDKVYALRDDLGAAQTSDPFVLVKYHSSPGRGPWSYSVFRVVSEEAPYFFSYPFRAGTPLQPVYPISTMPYSFSNTGVSGPFWQDRKTNFWARAAGDDGGTAKIVMHWFYVADDSFYFPSEPHKRAGQSIPFLDARAGTPGVPINVGYTTYWPDKIPDDPAVTNRIGSKDVLASLDVGETLVTRKKGLPAINGQCSAELIYQQAAAAGKGPSVALIDPLRERSVSLANLPADVARENVAGQIRFSKLPPSLRERFVYDPVQKKLIFRGILNTPAAGFPWLLLNVITPQDVATLHGSAPDGSRILGSDPAFLSAVDQLATLCNTVIPVSGSDTNFTSLALTAGFASDAGYVTLAFQNNRTTCDPGLPVSVEVVRVDCPLYRGVLRTILPASPFDESLTLRFDGDLAGRPDQYRFQWQYARDVDGRPPPDDDQSWHTVISTNDPASTGAIEYTIAGPGIFTLSDNWFRCLYRPISANSALCSGVSSYTPPQLAEGWIKRVLKGINAFDQCFSDLGDPTRTVDTLVTMISRAGKRWQGNVPLNGDACGNYGLIEIYESVFRRGISFSLEAGIDDPAVNQSLMLVAGRLAQLYLLLGNEAYADASDPTIAISSAPGDGFVGAPSTIHAFMNLADAPDLLSEELVLLRGRDDEFAPRIEESPTYNRFRWNFSGNDGQTAYKLNYEIRDVNGDGTINENDAALLYPQGHGDAWGHYLSAAKNYYRLFRNNNFDWIPRSEAVLIGGSPVTVNYLHERNFAKAAAAKAQVGSEVVSLTYRALYTADPANQWLGYKDGYASPKSSDADADPGAKTNEIRAWGLSDWGSRAGQGAVLDWLIGNAIVPAQHTPSYRITADSVSGISSESRFTIRLGAITNEIASSLGGTSVDLITNLFDTNFVARLAALDNLSFAGFAALDNALDSVLTADDPLRPLIYRVSQTAGLPRKVLAAVESLQDSFFSSADALQAALQRLLGEASFAAYGSLILKYVYQPNDANAPVEQRVDRSTVLELRDVAAGVRSIQAEVDKADFGVNPLGLVKDIIPFDIDPALLDPPARKSHFEQIYDRAVTALNNAIAVFNRAESSTIALRKQADDQASFAKTVNDREADFRSRMIELFGYPYADDIGGGGAYPAGYDGPDIYHFSYVDPSELVGESPGAVNQYLLKLSDLGVDRAGNLVRTNVSIPFTVSNNGFGEVKPPGWTGSRKAPGTLQSARSDLIQARGRLLKGLVEYNNLISQIESQANQLEAQYALDSEKIAIQLGALGKQVSLNQAIRDARERSIDFATKARYASMAANALSEGFPREFIAGLAAGGDFTFSLRSALQFAGSVASEAFTEQSNQQSLEELDAQQAKELTQSQTSIAIEKISEDFAIQQAIAQLQQLVRTEPVQRLDLFNLQESLQQLAGNYLSTLAKAERLREDFIRFRKDTAAEVAEMRYKDMGFRIFRNDALQKYRAQFDLAAAYVYTAARAYDWDSNLLEGDRRKPASSFLSDIVKTRAIGLVQNGVPQTASSEGDAGLADPMARMSSQWSFLKNQIGIINPQDELHRFSLRSELFRVVQGSAGDKNWKETLATGVVTNIFDLPLAHRYAIPPSTNVEPGIVLRFRTDVTFGQNFFGLALAGGDSGYDPTLYSTKIRSAGVSFVNYNSSALAKTPKVYLIPVGADIFRAPFGGGRTREWTVVDQSLPVFQALGLGGVDRQDWIPTIDELQGNFGDIRKFSSFLAHYDSPDAPAEVTQTGRLIGRSVWNTDWLLIIPAGTMLNDRQEAINTFINGPLVNGRRSGGVSDILIAFKTYAYSANQ